MKLADNYIEIKANNSPDEYVGGNYNYNDGSGFILAGSEYNKMTNAAGQAFVTARNAGDYVKDEGGNFIKVGSVGDFVRCEGSNDFVRVGAAGKGNFIRTDTDNRYVNVKDRQGNYNLINGAMVEAINGDGQWQGQYLYDADTGFYIYVGSSEENFGKVYDGTGKVVSMFEDTGYIGGYYYSSSTGRYIRVTSAIGTYIAVTDNNGDTHYFQGLPSDKQAFFSNFSQRLNLDDADIFNGTGVVGITNTDGVELRYNIETGKFEGIKFGDTSCQVGYGNYIRQWGTGNFIKVGTNAGDYILSNGAFVIENGDTGSYTKNDRGTIHYYIDEDRNPETTPFTDDTNDTSTYIYTEDGKIVNVSDPQTVGTYVWDIDHGEFVKIGGSAGYYSYDESSSLANGDTNGALVRTTDKNGDIIFVDVKNDAPKYYRDGGDDAGYSWGDDATKNCGYLRNENGKFYDLKGNGFVTIADDDKKLSYTKDTVNFENVTYTKGTYDNGKEVYIGSNGVVMVPEIINANETGKYHTVVTRSGDYLRDEVNGLFYNIGADKSAGDFVRVADPADLENITKDRYFNIHTGEYYTYDGNLDKYTLSGIGGDYIRDENGFFIEINGRTAGTHIRTGEEEFVAIDDAKSSTHIRSNTAAMVDIDDIGNLYEYFRDADGNFVKYEDGRLIDADGVVDSTLYIKDGDGYAVADGTQADDLLYIKAEGDDNEFVKLANITGKYFYAEDGMLQVDGNGDFILYKKDGSGFSTSPVSYGRQDYGYIEEFSPLSDDTCYVSVVYNDDGEIVIWRKDKDGNFTSDTWQGGCGYFIDEFGHYISAADGEGLYVMTTGANGEHKYVNIKNGGDTFIGYEDQYTEYQWKDGFMQDESGDFIGIGDDFDPDNDLQDKAVYIRIADDENGKPKYQLISKNNPNATVQEYGTGISVNIQTGTNAQTGAYATVYYAKEPYSGNYTEIYRNPGSTAVKSIQEEGYLIKTYTGQYVCIGGSVNDKFTQNIGNKINDNVRSEIFTPELDDTFIRNDQGDFVKVGAGQPTGDYLDNYGAYYTIKWDWANYNVNTGDDGRILLADIDDAENNDPHEIGNNAEGDWLRTMDGQFINVKNIDLRSAVSQNKVTLYQKDSITGNYVETTDVILAAKTYFIQNSDGNFVEFRHVKDGKVNADTEVYIHIDGNERRWGAGDGLVAFKDWTSKDGIDNIAYADAKTGNTVYIKDTKGTNDTKDDSYQLVTVGGYRYAGDGGDFYVFDK